MATKWEAIENGKRWAIFPVGPLGEAHILSVSTTAFDQEGIARLAAAAPEILVALKILMADDGVVNCGIANAGPLAQRKFIAAARAAKDAIAKAEGAQCLT